MTMSCLLYYTRYTSSAQLIRYFHTADKYQTKAALFFFHISITPLILGRFSKFKQCKNCRHLYFPFWINFLEKRVNMAYSGGGGNGGKISEKTKVTCSYTAIIGADSSDNWPGAERRQVNCRCCRRHLTTTPAHYKSCPARPPPGWSPACNETATKLPEIDVFSAQNGLSLAVLTACLRTMVSIRSSRRARRSILMVSLNSPCLIY